MNYNCLVCGDSLLILTLSLSILFGKEVKWQGEYPVPCSDYMSHCPMPVNSLLSFMAQK